MLVEHEPTLSPCFVQPVVRRGGLIQTDRTGPEQRTVPVDWPCAIWTG